MERNRWNLKGKQAIVTGGTKGIGKAIVDELVALGANVVTTSRNKHEIKHEKIAHYQCDVSKTKELDRFLKIINENHQTIDILINNVGTNIRKKTVDYTDEEFDHILNTNLRAAFKLGKELHPLLKNSVQGNVINIVSTAGLTRIRTGAIYGMTKAALVHLTKYWAGEWAEDNIRVNAIAPWYIRTPLVEGVLSDNDYYNEVIERTPMRKIGKPEDISGISAFLCMPAADYITGQCISVDGGFMINGF